MNSRGAIPALRVTEPLPYLRPPVHPVHVRRLQRDPLPPILRRNRRPVALPAEHIRSRHEPLQIRQHQRPALNLLLERIDSRGIPRIATTPFIWCRPSIALIAAACRCGSHSRSACSSTMNMFPSPSVQPSSTTV